MGGTPNTGPLGWESPHTGGIEPHSPPTPAGLSIVLEQLFSPPDRQSYQASNRRRLLARPAQVTVPITGSNTSSAIITMPDVLTQGDGIWFEYFAGLVTAADATGHLTIVDTALQLGNGGNLFLPLGTPQPTTLIPRISTSMLFSPTPLLTSKDLDEWSRLRGFGSIFGAVSPLTIQLDVSMANNDGAATHNFQLALWCAYRIINGLTGA